MRLYDNEGYREEFMALVYDLLHSDGTNDRANQIIDAFDMAPTVEAEPLFPNDPLTLDELREMDGEPVWGADGQCYIVNVKAGYAVDKDRGFRMLWGDGFFYRRRPEEVQYDT